MQFVPQNSKGRYAIFDLERNAENSYLASDAVSGGSMDQLLGHSITYRIAVGPQAGRKVFTLQTLPACDPEEQYCDTAGS